MPIDATTTIDEIRLAVNTQGGVPAVGVEAIVYRRSPSPRYLYVPRNGTGDYDQSNAEVREVIQRIRTGTPAYYYIIDDYLAVNLGLSIGYNNPIRDYQLPRAYHHLRHTHPFHSNFVDADLSRGPYIGIFFQRSATVPTGTAVTFTALESVGHFDSRVELGGWKLDPPSGTDTLYWQIVRYGAYTDGYAWTEPDSVETGDIQWSVDHARTWITDPPAIYRTVTHARVLDGTAWLGIPVNTDVDPDNPFTELSPHNGISSIPSNGVMSFEVSGAGLRDLYQIGMRMDTYNQFDLVVVSGEGWLSTNAETHIGADPAYGLHLIPPAELDDTSTPPPPPYAYVLSMDLLTGEVRIDHTDLGIGSTTYDGRAACYLTFAGFTVTTLINAVLVGDTSILLASSVGLKMGDVLFIEDEQLRISGHVGGSTIDVTRGVNGTTAVAHASGTTVRGSVTQDMLHLIHLWDVDNTIPTRCRAGVVGLKRAGR